MTAPLPLTPATPPEAVPVVTSEEHRSTALGLVAESGRLPGANVDRPVRVLLEALVHAVLSLKPEPIAEPAPKRPQAKRQAPVVVTPAE